jgi:FixJ family two-component response regulator
MEAQGNVVVVLEDDPRLREALCLLLADWDFRVVSSGRAGEALALVGPSLGAVMAVITDFDLGAGVNGVDEAHALRAAGISAPVLVISGSLQGNAVEKAREAGFHFLRKPVKPLDIENWLAARIG